MRHSAHHGAHVPSADVENGPGAKAGGGQIQHGFRDFFRFAQPVQWHSPPREFGTDMRTAEQRELSTRGVPLARLGEPEEIAEAVLYLATASFCTGTILNISGGNVRAVLC